MKSNDELSFWSRVQKSDGCWLWTGAKDKDGYGKLSFRNRDVRAHRLAYILSFGAVPARLVVMHRCDTPACVRPDHLCVGSTAENNADRNSKGRQAHGAAITENRNTAKGARHGWAKHPDRIPRGAQHYAATITDESVRAMRAAFDGGMRIKDIVEKFGVKRNVVSKVVRRVKWTHVKEV